VENGNENAPASKWRKGGMTMRLTRLRFAVVATLCALLPATAVAQTSVADFYKGKNIDFIVGYSPGAGFDLYGRMLAQFIGRHIPGSPNVVVKNMPGAASLKGLQFISQQAPRDGATIGIFNPTLVNLSVLEPQQVDVDFAKLTWLGNMSNDTKVCFAWGATGVRTIDDIRKRGIIIGGTSQGAGFVYGSILKAIFGDKMKAVLGYPSNSDVWLAMERGEVEGNCTGWGVIPAMRPEWISGRKVNVFIQFAKQPSRLLPDVPLIYDVDVSTEMKAAITFLTLSDTFTRPIIAPPGVPAERVKALREAFQATMRDPEFLAQAEKSNLEIEPMDADTLAGLVQEVRATPASAVELAKKLSQ
jgi:tripartite-type tricarboxylate transporter receptor subunit TctC